MIDYHLHLWPHSESSVWYRTGPDRRVLRRGRAPTASPSWRSPSTPTASSTCWSSSARSGSGPATSRRAPLMAEYFDFTRAQLARGVRHPGAARQGRGPAGQDRPRGRLLRDQMDVVGERYSPVPLRRADRIGPLARHLAVRRRRRARPRCTSGRCATSTSVWADYAMRLRGAGRGERGRRAGPPRPDQGRRLLASTPGATTGTSWRTPRRRRTCRWSARRPAGSSRSASSTPPRASSSDWWRAGVTFTTASDAHGSSASASARGRPRRPARGARRARARLLHAAASG